jgi:hypothetical protein
VTNATALSKAVTKIKVLILFDAYHLSFPAVTPPRKWAVGRVAYANMTNGQKITTNPQIK